MKCKSCGGRLKHRLADVPTGDKFHFECADCGRRYAWSKWEAPVSDHKVTDDLQ